MSGRLLCSLITALLFLSGAHAASFSIGSVMVPGVVVNGQAGEIGAFVDGVDGAAVAFFYQGPALDDDGTTVSGWDAGDPRWDDLPRVHIISKECSGDACDGNAVRYLWAVDGLAPGSYRLVAVAEEMDSDHDWRFRLDESVAVAATFTVGIKEPASAKSCVELGGTCSCGDGFECLPENRVEGSIDCPDSCCLCTPGEVPETPNKPPIAKALVGFTRAEAKKTASMRLDDGMRFFGSDSVDPDGSIVWYKWDYGDGASYEGTEGDTSHVYNESGTYEARLTVRDDKGAEDTSEPVNVTVYGNPTAVPRVGISVDDLKEESITINAGEIVQAQKFVFEGSWSYSPNGDIVKYRWLEFESGERYIDFQIIAPRAEKEIRFPGDYEVHLEVTDSVGAVGHDSVLVKIEADPTSPVAVALAGTSIDDMNYEEISANYGQEIYFSGLGSESMDGRPIGYFWELGDFSPRVNNFLTSHTYEFHPQEGLEKEYTVTLYVASESGAVSRDTIKVELSPTLQNKYAAIIKAGTDPESLAAVEGLRVGADQRVYLDCSDSDTGEIRQCVWHEVDEPLEWVRNIGFGDRASSKFQPGIHYVRLRAYDGVGDLGEAVLTINVDPGPEEEEHGLTLLYVPFDWEGSLDGFDEMVGQSAGYIVNHIPLKDCPGKLEYINAGENCVLDMPRDGVKSSDALEYCRDELDRWAAAIKRCAERTGREYDYVIGVTDHDVCGQASGMSVVGTDISWFEKSSLSTILHELGHNWGLWDEYFDACRCDDYISGPNCLKEELDGDEGIWPELDEYCAGGTKCVVYTGLFNSPCKGNRNEGGGRCIMTSDPYHPQEFCPVCMAHLGTIPELNCGGVEDE